MLDSESGELQQNDDGMGPARGIRVNSARAAVFAHLTRLVGYFIFSCQSKPLSNTAILILFQHTKTLNGERSKDKRRR